MEYPVSGSVLNDDRTAIKPSASSSDDPTPGPGPSSIPNSTSSLPQPDTLPTTCSTTPPSSFPTHGSSQESSDGSSTIVESRSRKDADNPDLFRTIIIPSGPCVPPKHPEGMPTLDVSLNVIQKQDGSLQFVPDTTRQPAISSESLTWREGAAQIPRSEQQPHSNPSASTSSSTAAGNQHSHLMDPTAGFGWIFNQKASPTHDTPLDGEALESLSIALDSFQPSSTSIMSDGQITTSGHEISSSQVPFGASKLLYYAVALSYLIKHNNLT